MTPEEKAKELVFYYENLLSPLVTEPATDFLITRCVKCAIIAVDELISSFSAYKGMYDQEFFDSELKYWQQVKQHLNEMKS